VNRVSGSSGSSDRHPDRRDGVVNRWQRLIRRLGQRRWFVAFGRLVVPLDTAVQRATNGRVAIIAPSGLPHLLLTVTGAKTGQLRRIPLIYVPDGDRYVVVGSNWGKPTHPAWSANLLANPDAIANLRGREIPVRGRLVEGAERDRLWALATAMWPGYDGYAGRTHREIRLFVLERRRSW